MMLLISTSHLPADNSQTKYVTSKNALPRSLLWSTPCRSLFQVGSDGIIWGIWAHSCTWTCANDFCHPVLGQQYLLWAQLQVSYATRVHELDPKRDVLKDISTSAGTARCLYKLVTTPCMQMRFYDDNRSAYSDDNIVDTHSWQAIESSRSYFPNCNAVEIDHVGMALHVCLATDVMIPVDSVSIWPLSSFSLCSIWSSVYTSVEYQYMQYTMQSWRSKSLAARLMTRGWHTFDANAWPCLAHQSCETSFCCPCTPSPSTSLTQDCNNHSTAARECIWSAPWDWSSWRI